MKKILVIVLACIISVFLIGNVIFYLAIAPTLNAPSFNFGSIKILDRNGDLLYEAPNPDSGWQAPIALDRIPSLLIQTILASEDQRFYEHRGVDMHAIIRAIKERVTGHARSGASTIEQQLVKNLFFRREPRSIIQKLREMIAAIAWARRHTKNKTLVQYLNTIPLSQRSIGIQTASKRFFHKDVSDLDIAEIAMLTGTIAAPSTFDLYMHASEAKKRQVHVLSLMRDKQLIDQTQMEDALHTRIVLFPIREEIYAPHFVHRVLRDLLEEQFPKILTKNGLIVRTTLDLNEQRIAHAAVTRSLAKLTEQNVHNAAVLLVNTKTGDTLAYVGNADYFDDRIQGKVDLVTAKRQPGSVLKPFLVFQAFMQGFTPATILDDAPRSFVSADGSRYEPQNYRQRYHGSVTIREALGNSLNVPMVELLERVELETFFGSLRRFGITFNQPPSHYGLSLILGGGEVSLELLTQAYATLSRGAQKMPIRNILEIRETDGTLIFKAKTPDSIPVFENDTRAKQASRLVTDILQDPQARLWSFGAGTSLNLGKAVAVKTGTTKNFRDNWAIGYTPTRVLGVWVGNADAKTMKGVSGVTGAVPIWREIMLSELKDIQSFQDPSQSGLIKRETRLERGQKRVEWFMPGTESESTGTEMQSRALKIVASSSGDVFDLNNLVAEGTQRIPFIANGSSTEFIWTLNSETLVSKNPRFLWTPKLGNYTLTLKGTNRAVSFSVRK